MRRPVVAGNWKMHGSRSANGALLRELEQRLNPEWPVDVVVFPPFVYLADAARTLRNLRLLCVISAPCWVACKVIVWFRFALFV